MRWLSFAALCLTLCACGRLVQYGDPRLRPQPDKTASSAPGDAGQGEELELTGKGTVRWVDEDGGFWGVRADDGRSYRLRGLSPVYQKDGTRIRFRGRARGAGDFAPWHTVVDLTDVSGV
jgi:hypothetical protein